LLMIVDCGLWVSVTADIRVSVLPWTRPCLLPCLFFLAASLHLPIYLSRCSCFPFIRLPVLLLPSTRPSSIPLQLPSFPYHLTVSFTRPSIRVPPTRP
jgi:hypothetical protein